MRRFSIGIFPGVACLALAACGTADAPVENDVSVEEEATQESGIAVSPYGSGVIRVESDEDVEATVERLEAALEEGEFTIVSKLDHQANAEKTGLELGPATVIFFGKPEAGTPLMQAAPEASLDLPQRMAVYVKDGKTVIAYNDPVWLASRHGITEQQERLDAISAALKGLAEKAAGITTDEEAEAKESDTTE